MQRQDTDFEEKFEEVWEQVSYKAAEHSISGIDIHIIVKPIC